MRRAHYFLFFLLLVVLTGCTQSLKKSFRISGTITSDAPAFLILKKSENLQRRTTKVVDTLFLDNQGNFSKTFFEEPHLYYLMIRNLSIPLALDYNQQLEILGSIEDGFTTKGSPDTDLLNEYEDYRIQSLQNWVGSVRDEVKILRAIEGSEAKIKVLREKEVENYKIHLDELMTFVDDKMGTSVGVYATSLRWRGEEHLPFLKNLVLKFEELYPNTELSRQLRDRFVLLEKTSVGGQVENIELADLKNEITSLNTSKGKYTLIDFWASWCGPCRAESDLLNELYANYKRDGFEIYGVSLDSRQERWVNAIEKDQRNWVNVVSFEGLKSEVAYKFGVNALPTNFIIDKEGSIIAKNIHGEHLNATVKSLFRD